MGGESCTVLRLRLMRKLAMSLMYWDILDLITVCYFNIRNKKIRRHEIQKTKCTKLTLSALNCVTHGMCNCITPRVSIGNLCYQLATPSSFWTGTALDDTLFRNPNRNIKKGLFWQYPLQLPWPPSVLQSVSHPTGGNSSPQLTMNQKSP